jgi:hypothetical protein
LAFYFLSFEVSISREVLVMKKLVVLFVFLSFITLQAQDTADVEYTFTITDEFNNSQELIIGKDPFGSDGLDPQFGEVVIPQVPAGQFGARLVLPTDSSSTILKDIRFGCFWADGFSHLIDLSYAVGSTQMNIDWEWDQTSIYFLMSVFFYNPINGNLIQYFDYLSDSSYFNIPIGLEKIRMVASYNGTLSVPQYQVISPNGGDTLYIGQTYNINFWLWGAPGLGIYFSSNAGNTWELIAGVPALPTYYQWTVPNVISDSCLIMVGGYPCVYDVSDNFFSIIEAVPVELLSFSSSIIDDDVTLNWTTATETNNSGFQIERRETKNERSEDWRSIGFVNGNGTTTESQTYFYIDENLFAGKYQYRLKQIDFDGTFEYSNIIETEILPPAKFSLEQNYPNPFNPSTTIKYSIPDVGTGLALSVQLIVYDVLGNEVATLINEEKPAGNYEVEFNASELASGLYFYQLKSEGLTQTRKMILIR